MPGTYGWFEWGADSNYGNTTTAIAVDEGFTTNVFSQTLPDALAGLTTYHFQAAASHAVAFVHGPDLSFQTPSPFYAFPLYGFTDSNDGGSPNGLVQGSGGNFYGTTSEGGTNYASTVFKIIKG